MPAGYVFESGIWRAQSACLQHYDPEYMQRACAMWNDGRIAGKYYVYSGARSTELQAYLYNGWIKRLPGFSPANKPGTSKHEWKPDQGASAMDVHPFVELGGTYALLHAIADEYGFAFTIPNEDWHMQFKPRRKALYNTGAITRQKTEVEEMPSYEWKDGATAVLLPDGNVYCPTIENRPTAQHYGGMNDLRADAKRAYSGIPTLIVGVDPSNSNAGYIIMDDSFSDSYKFEPGVDRFFKKQ